MQQVFAIAPSQGSGAIWMLVLIPLLVIVALAVAVNSGRSSRFEVSREGLRLRGDFYGRLIEAGHLQIDGARRVDLSAEPALAPRFRTLGTGMPGYRAGWFRLGNGEKALLYLTDRQRTVYVPTDDGYSVLLSPADPDGFLSALRAMK